MQKLVIDKNYDILRDKALVLQEKSIDAFFYCSKIPFIILQPLIISSFVIVRGGVMRMAVLVNKK